MSWSVGKLDDLVESAVPPRRVSGYRGGATLEGVARLIALRGLLDLSEVRVLLSLKRLEAAGRVERWPSPGSGYWNRVSQYPE